MNASDVIAELQASTDQRFQELACQISHGEQPGPEAVQVLAAAGKSVKDLAQEALRQKELRTLRMDLAGLDAQKEQLQAERDSLAPQVEEARQQHLAAYQRCQELDGKIATGLAMQRILANRRSELEQRLQRLENSR